MDTAGIAGRRLAFWRIGLWLVLLLSAFGALQYGTHAGRVWHVLAQPALGVDGRAALHGMLAWDLAYLVAAGALVVFCAAGILRQGWSRPVLRVALGLLAAGILTSGLVLLHHWHVLTATPPGASDVSAQLTDLARTVHLSLTFDALAIALLAWLVWSLGRPSVRAQFRRRP